VKRFTRTCLICGGEARVLAPEGSDDLDVEAEFSGAARALGDDNETVGVACYRCAEKVWRAERGSPAVMDLEQEDG
jgi:sirohydrochlorin ferrochelatase